MSPLTIKKIAKHGNARYVVDMRGSGGGRKFFESGMDAARFAKIKQEEIDRLGEAAHSLTDADRAEFVLARQKLNGSATILQAVDFYLSRNCISNPMPLALALGQCLKEKREAGRKKRYTDKLEWCIGPLAEAVKKACHEITRDDISKWFASTEWGGNTKKHVLVDLKTFFQYCVQRGWTLTNPCDGIVQFTVDDKSPGILTVDQCSRLLTTARKKFRSLLGYCALGMFAGIRTEEAKAMDWGMVDTERGFAEVPARVAKMRKRRIVKLEPVAVDWLQLCRRKGRIVPVGFAKKFVACRKSAGMSVWPHNALRHSFASYHLAAFGSADKTATQMGHRDTDELFAHYREIVKPEEAARFFALRP